MRNPVAMPAHYGYDVLSEYADDKESSCTIQDILKERAKREGMEDAGDVMARQVGGNHYKTTSIQPWDIFAAYGLDPWSANVVKYILRFPYKAGRQDLEKAKHYIDYLISHYDEVHDKYYD